jgi:hypothetical protein
MPRLNPKLLSRPMRILVYFRFHRGISPGQTRVCRPDTGAHQSRCKVTISTFQRHADAPSAPLPTAANMWLFGKKKTPTELLRCEPLPTRPNPSHPLMPHTTPTDFDVC